MIGVSEVETLEATYVKKTAHCTMCGKSGSLHDFTHAETCRLAKALGLRRLK